MKYNKLVRDKIPEIIRKKGKTPIIHVADNKEYFEKLKEKLNEEVREFLENPNEDELCDVLEVFYAILNFKNIDIKDLERLRKQKEYERGSFKDRIILDEVI